MSVRYTLAINSSLCGCFLKSTQEPGAGWFIMFRPLHMGIKPVLLKLVHCFAAVATACFCTLEDHEVQELVAA